MYGITDGTAAPPAPSAAFGLELSPALWAEQLLRHFQPRAAGGAVRGVDKVHQRPAQKSGE